MVGPKLIPSLETLRVNTQPELEQYFFVSVTLGAYLFVYRLAEVITFGVNLRTSY